jgi:hypothetical protein
MAMDRWRRRLAAQTGSEFVGIESRNVRGWGEPRIIRQRAPAHVAEPHGWVKGAEREKQTAKSIVFEGSGDVNTCTRRMTAKRRLVTAFFAAN